MQKYRVGIIGATGMVGQRFLTLLADHPWFEVTALAASARSAGQTYREAVASRWAFDWPIPDYAADMTILDAADVNALAEKVDFTFCAVDMPKDQIRALEDSVAKTETPVVSNNSAHRWTKDVPMMVPEVNADQSPAPRSRWSCGCSRSRPPPLPWDRPQSAPLPAPSQRAAPWHWPPRR